MKAMILAAGEGRRMRPLTLARPKPLLPVAQHSLIEHQIIKLKDAGFTDLVINVSYLGEQIMRALGDGRQLGVVIRYSQEPQPLETGGGIARALPLLGDSPFLLINGDIWTDYPLAQLSQREPPKVGAHLVLVGNPVHHRGGDFALANSGEILGGDAPVKYTYSGVGLIDPAMVRTYPRLRERMPLLEILQWAIGRRKLTGEVYQGRWLDVGTPERLAEVNRLVSSPF